MPEECDSYQQHLFGTSDEQVFHQACMERCVSHVGDMVPDDEMCDMHVCPIMMDCVMDHETQAFGDFAQVLDCIGHLHQHMESAGVEHPRDIEDEMEQHHGVDPFEHEYNNHVAGQPLGVFHHACMVKCPDHNGHDHMPDENMCGAMICPQLQECVAVPSMADAHEVVAGDYGVLMHCINELFHEEPEEGHPEEEEVEEELSQANHHDHHHPEAGDAEMDHIRLMYSQHVAGHDIEVFTGFCNMHCPDAEGDGIPGFEACDQHICPALTFCMATEDGLAKPFDHLFPCIGELEANSPHDHFDETHAEESTEEFQGRGECVGHNMPPHCYDEYDHFPEEPSMPPTAAEAVADAPPKPVLLHKLSRAAKKSMKLQRLFQKH
jgi:hypothetical protein